MAVLPEYLVEQTEEEIRMRMLAAVPTDLDSAEGSYIWDSLAPAAIELALAAIWAQQVLERGFVQTTFGQYLDLRAEEFGLLRRAAVKATGQVTFTGTVGTVLPAGTRVATPVGESQSPLVEFQTTTEATLATLDAGGSATIDVEAVEAGVSGNVAAGTIIILSVPVSGTTSVNNPAATTGGLDIEEDISLRARILESAQKDEGDGNIADYEIWSKEITGVGNVLVEPLWQGEGTVRVVVLDTVGRPTPSATISAVQEHLDPGIQGNGSGRAPVGAKVTVATATEKLIDVHIPGLIAEEGYTVTQARANAEAALSAYFDQKINPGGILRIREAEAAALNASGVLDVDEISLNGARSNITLAVTELVTLGTVTYA